MRKRFLFAVIVLMLFQVVSCDTNGSAPDEYTILPLRFINDDSLRVLLFGDSGTGDQQQRDVAEAMALRNKAAPYDFALMLGDNFYETGVSDSYDPQFDSKFRLMYSVQNFNFPFYVVLGNHDHYGNPQAQYEYLDPDGRWKLPDRAYLLPVYTSNGKHIDFYFLDSEYLQDQTAGTAIALWVEKLVRSRKSDLTILAAHRPFHSSGAHGDDPRMNYRFASLLEDGLINIAVAGHDHDLELQERDQNQDGIKEWFIVSGAAGKVRPIEAGPFTKFSKGDYGFAELTFDASGFQLDFFDAGGQLLFSRSEAFAGTRQQRKNFYGRSRAQ